MVSTTSLRPAKKFGPGYFIKEQLELRDWTQEDLASVLNISPKHINKILQDQQTLTFDNARLFAEIFDTTTQYWVNLNTTYQLWLRQEKSEQEKEADVKAMIYERMPVKDMIAKRWLTPFDTTNDLVNQVKLYWKMDELNFSNIDQKYQPFLARKSDSYNQFNAAYAFAWFQKAKDVAERQERKPYNKSALQTLFDQIHQFTIAENGINVFLKQLSECGVIFFVLPHLQKTYLDGAAFFSGVNPVVVYTARYKRIDNFWFTVSHEIAHVLLHLDEKTPYFLDDLQHKSSDEFEKQANHMAAEKLKHPEILAQMSTVANYLSPKKVQECAHALQIHPAIITGKLAYAKRISYANQNRYNENVLDLLDGRWKF